MEDFGILSSLGIGSGVLTYNVIDKLKKVDTDLMIKPLEDKLDFIGKQEKALNQFINIFDKIKSEVYDFANGLVTSKVKSTVNGSSVVVNVEAGTKPQNFNINVKQLAQNDIYESNGFSSINTIISNKNTTVTIGLGGTSTTLKINSGTTLEELKDIINNSGIGITASIINTGTDTNPYKLILKGNETGKDNIITFDYGTIDDLGFNQTVYQSTSYNSDTDSVNNSGSTQQFKITINGTTYSMNVANGTTVSNFVNDINNGELKDSNGNVLQGISAQYNSNTGRIEIHLQQIGNISIDDTGLTTNINSNTDFNNINKLQTAQNSIFDYDGVEITRSTNKIKNLIPGVTLDLKSLGESDININYDVNNTIKKLNQFVIDYNKFIDNLQSLTAFNQKKGTVGLFNNDLTFKGIENSLYESLFSNIDVTKLGLSYNKKGHLIFDSNTYLTNFNNNSEKMNNLLETVFNKLDASMNNIENSLKLDNQNLTEEEKRLKKQEENLNKLLDEKYDTMAMKFSEYDEMINRFNVQAQTIQQLIQQSINNK